MNYEQIKYFITAAAERVFLDAAEHTHFSDVIAVSATALSPLADLRRESM